MPLRATPTSGDYGPRPTYWCCEHCVMEFDEEEQRFRCADAILNKVPDLEPAHPAPCPSGCMS